MTALLDTAVTYLYFSQCDLGRRQVRESSSNRSNVRIGNSRRWRLTRMIPAAVAVGALALTVSPLSAHAFGQRYDLPIPLNYFLVGAVATVFLSFVLIGLFVQRRPGKFGYPRLNLLNVPILGAVLSSPIVHVVIRAVSVLMFLLLLVAGFFGTDRAIENISPTFIWIIWWVGMGYIVALVGNVWVFVNPWKITFEWYQRLRGHADEPEDPPFTYPQGLASGPRCCCSSCSPGPRTSIPARSGRSRCRSWYCCTPSSCGSGWRLSASTSGSETARRSPCSLGSSHASLPRS